MSDHKKLGEIQPGNSVIVQIIEGDELKSNLLELGLTTGSHVRVLYKAPLGDPIAIDVEGFVLSLRKSEANLIHVAI